MWNSSLTSAKIGKNRQTSLHETAKIAEKDLFDVDVIPLLWPLIVVILITNPMFTRTFQLDIARSINHCFNRSAVFHVCTNVACAVDFQLYVGHFDHRESDISCSVERSINR